jgi:hypothetical protein
MPDSQALQLATCGMMEFKGESKTIAAMPDESVMNRQAEDMRRAINSLKARTGRTEFTMPEVNAELDRLNREM